MRILYLSPWFPYPLDTGFRVRVYHMLRVMAHQHRITLLTLDPQGWAPAQIEPVRPLCEHVEIVHADPFNRSRVQKATRFLSFGPIVATPFAEMSARVRQLHQQQPFDVVIASSVMMAAYALDMPNVTRILEEHNSNTRWMYDRYQTQTVITQKLRCWASWRKSAAYEARLFKHFDLITMVSEQDAALTRELVHNQQLVAVSPNGVDATAFTPGLVEPQPDTLIFGGALRYEANFEAMQYFLKEAYPLIKQRRSKVTLRITGSTEQAHLDALALDNSVTLTGVVTDVRQEVARAWVSIAPILSGGGTRLKILESMALGTPVVATSKGAEGIEAFDGQHLLIANNARAFAECVVGLLANRTQREQLAQQARQLVVERYDWKAIGRQFLEHAEQVHAGMLDSSRQATRIIRQEINR
jgi:polysaccharide biosynthesis protein PslH